jgi:hypothetical protein
MSDNPKIGTSHLSRAAYVYLRQSSPAQVEHNRESTQRQYALVSKASTLGWPPQQVVVAGDDFELTMLRLKEALLVSPDSTRRRPNPVRPIFRSARRRSRAGRGSGSATSRSGRSQRRIRSLLVRMLEEKALRSVLRLKVVFGGLI